MTNLRMIKKSLLIWLSIIPLAILNGALRQEILSPWFGETIARPLSGIILCAMIFIVSWIFIPRIGKGDKKTYWSIAIIWIALTIVFETIVGLTMGNTCAELLQAYDITTGNLWLLVVLFIGIVPWLVAKRKKLL